MAALSECLVLFCNMAAKLVLMAGVFIKPVMLITPLLEALGNSTNVLRTECMCAVICKDKYVRHAY